MEPKSESMALESPKLGKKQIESTYRILKIHSIILI